MAKLRILIADDERPARSYLKGLLRTFPDAELVGEAENGAEAVEMLHALRPDLALLDLQMPVLTGFEVVRELEAADVPLVAFVTAFDQYAVQAFEMNAIDYLLKPVEAGRLAMTLERAAERLGHPDWRAGETRRLNDAASAYEELGRSEFLQRIPVKKRDEFYLINVEEIASIVADGELLKLTTQDGRRFEFNFRLKDLEERLDPSRFIRLSRGAIVNIDSVSHISPLPGGTYNVALTNGQEVASSRLQSKILRSRLLRL
ncbi:MAG: response regulator transcription factor [Chloracidobacterium sp.]|nr:response regulator transcription factor [Chloracidobacterium sp.]